MAGAADDIRRVLGAAILAGHMRDRLKEGPDGFRSNNVAVCRIITTRRVRVRGPPSSSHHLRHELIGGGTQNGQRGRPTLCCHGADCAARSQLTGLSVNTMRSASIFVAGSPQFSV